MAFEQYLERQWVINIKQKLYLGGQVENDEPWTKHSIYKIPNWMKDGDRPNDDRIAGYIPNDDRIAGYISNDDRIAGYIPEIISFGPYHHGQSHLQQMEDHKWRVLNHMLKREDQDISLYLIAVKEVEQKARACYDSVLYHQISREFVEMMVLDGCFVLEFLRGKAVGYDNLDYGDSDPVFYKDSICHVIAMDLMKLENQIPLIVLQKLNEVQYEGNAETGEVPKLVMSVLTPRWVLINAPATDEQLKNMRDGVAEEHGSEPMVHCLDVFRRSLMYKPKSRPNKLRCEEKLFEDDCEHFMANCVSDLKEAGIKFKPRYKLPFWEVQFKQSSGVLEIHPFKIGSATETIFRNLIAFEQCHMNNPEDMVITSYVAFMDKLIDTASDVAYLRVAGIIVHYLGSDQEVADLFNRLVVKRVYVSKKTGGIQDIYQKLNKYCSHRRNWWRASLENEYLTNPWVIISIFAALLLFLLTAVQTGYTVYAYYKPPS